MVFTHELRGDTIDFCNVAAGSLAVMVADLGVDFCYHLFIPIVKTRSGCTGGHKKKEDRVWSSLKLLKKRVWPRCLFSACPEMAIFP